MKQYQLKHDLPGVMKGEKISYNQDDEKYYIKNTLYTWSRGIVEGDDGKWFKLEEVPSPVQSMERERIEPQFVIGVDPIRGNFEWKDDAQTQVIFKKEEKGEWIAMYRKDKSFNQQEFEADMKEAMEYFSKVPILCEECGEIGKHKSTCSKYCTPSPASEVRDVLFTTEDGVKVFEGDEHWWVCLLEEESEKNICLDEKWQIGKGVANKATVTSKNYKHFSTGRSLNEYILNHKPCFSLHEIFEIKNMLNDETKGYDAKKYLYNAFHAAAKHKQSQQKTGAGGGGNMG